MLRFLYILTFLSYSFIGFTQSELREDFQVWLAADVEYGIMKKIDASLAIASRYENNARFNKNNFTELGLQFKQIENISITTSYRYSVKGSNNEVTQRFIATASYKYRIKPFDLSYRLRGDNFFGDDNLLDRVRNKFQIRYSKKKKRYRPYVSYEIFVTNEKSGWISDQYRAKAGVKYKLNKTQNIGIYYGIQSEFNTTRPQRDFILGSSYSYSFD